MKKSHLSSKVLTSKPTPTNSKKEKILFKNRITDPDELGVVTTSRKKKTEEKVEEKPAEKPVEKPTVKEEKPAEKIQETNKKAEKTTKTTKKAEKNSSRDIKSKKTRNSKCHKQVSIILATQDSVLKNAQALKT